MIYRNTIQIDAIRKLVWHKLKTGIAVAGLLAAGISPWMTPAQAASNLDPVQYLFFQSSGPSFEEFTRSITNGIADQIVGVYAPNRFALPVVQQPAGESGFVSSKKETVTQFDLAAEYQTIGLLAHNYLSGSLFFELEVDQIVTIVFGDGRSQEYRVAEVHSFQALNPTSTQSDFIDLSTPGQKKSAAEVFNQIYGAGDRLVFQTCIERNGDLSWGRLFVTAEPYPGEDSTPMISTPPVSSHWTLGVN